MNNFASQDTRDKSERDSMISINSDSIEIVSADDARFSAITRKPLLKDEDIIGAASKSKFDESKVCQTVHDSL